MHVTPYAVSQAHADPGESRPIGRLRVQDKTRTCVHHKKSGQFDDFNDHEGVGIDDHHFVAHHEVLVAYGEQRWWVIDSLRRVAAL